MFRLFSFEKEVIAFWIQVFDWHLHILHNSELIYHWQMKSEMSSKALLTFQIFQWDHFTYQKQSFFSSWMIGRAYFIVAIECRVGTIVTTWRQIFMLTAAGFHHHTQVQMLAGRIKRARGELRNGGKQLELYLRWVPVAGMNTQINRVWANAGHSVWAMPFLWCQLSGHIACRSHHRLPPVITIMNVESRTHTRTTTHTHKQRYCKK